MPYRSNHGLPASVRDHLPAHAQDIYSQGLHLAAHLPAIESFLFAVVSAVDLTTGLLPMVLALTLVEGARRLAARKGIVKRLSSIHDLGAMNILCADKTGTLTSR